MIINDPTADRFRRSSTGRFVSAAEADVHAGQRHAEHLKRQAADARWLAWQIGQIVPMKAPKLNRAQIERARWGYKTT